MSGGGARASNDSDEQMGKFVAKKQQAARLSVPSAWHKTKIERPVLSNQKL
jgi:hypothetical protein